MKYKITIFQDKYYAITSVKQTKFYTVTIIQANKFSSIQMFRSGRHLNLTFLAFQSYSGLYVHIIRIKYKKML